MHFLWMERSRKFISRQMFRKRPRRSTCARVFVSALRLCAHAATRKISATSPQTSRPKRIVTAAVHHFEESIAGRAYLIEVAAVTEDRWRAYIVRVPGVPTALMPFYGRHAGRSGAPVERMADACARARGGFLELTSVHVPWYVRNRIQLMIAAAAVWASSAVGSAHEWHS